MKIKTAVIQADTPVRLGEEIEAFMDLEALDPIRELLDISITSHGDMMIARHVAYITFRKVTC